MNIEELNTQIEYLKETKNLIKEQLIAKGQPIDDNTTFREYVDNMNDLVDTTDANATASDLAVDKTMYVNGQKITGTLRDIANGSASSFINTEYTIENKPQFNLLNFRLPFTEDVLHRQGSVEQLNVMYGKLNSVIGLTADKIKLGETILGITGTYAGSAMKEYASVTDMNNDIANISNNEVVKVVASETTTYYIKETISGTATMTKLVKESETISPQEYQENIELADEILGEEA